MLITVLGAGLVGGPMARDLAADERFDVLVVDRDPAALERLAALAPLRTAVDDLGDPERVAARAREADLVVEAMPGWMGFRTLETIIGTGTDVVSISFFAEDPFELDALARERGVRAIVDCGVFPGMGSALTMHAVRSLDRTDSVLVHVGGLPLNPVPPFNYRAVFSPVDVIEEYVRPARHLENGEIVVRPALSDLEILPFEPVGDLEVFSTDGIRTLATTLGVPNVREKTLRWPGTIPGMALLRDLGLFDEEPVNGVAPRDVTLPLLARQWAMPEGEGDLTVLRIEVKGERDGAPETVVWDLYDEWDAEQNVLSMARTTGYTATATVRLLVEGLYLEPGVSPPEYLGRDPKCVEFLLARLLERGVEYRLR